MKTEDRGFLKLFNGLRRRKAQKTIKDQGGRTRKVQIKYRKDSGEVVTRTVRPYEIKAHRTSGRQMLYVTDNKDGATSIKSYALRGITSAKRLPGKFKPHWPVQFEQPSEPFRKSLIPRRKRSK